MSVCFETHGHEDKFRNLGPMPKVPCTLVRVRRDRYEALLQLPCYRLGSEPTCYEERSVEEAKACSESTSPYTSDNEQSGSNF